MRRFGKSWEASGMQSERPLETRTGGRAATTGVIPGDVALSVGNPGSALPVGWRWRLLTDVARLETGHTPSRRHPEWWGGSVPWIGIRDATGNHGTTIHKTEQYTNEAGIRNSSARILPANTVCLSRTASVGYVVVMGVPMATSQDFVNWVCGRELDHQYLKYVLIAERQAFRRFASGTTHQTIYFPEVKAFHVAIPPLTIQQGIVGVLGALDDRIDLLRQTNATLESIAQALFKSWFIDFDPVRAKAEGRQPEGMDADTAALFPADFEESTLGLIPKEWRVLMLDELCDTIFSGGTPDTRKPEYWHGTLPWFSSGETRETVVIETEKQITQTGVANSSTRLARPGDVLIASAGQGLTRGQTSFCAIDTYINQSVVSVRTNRQIANPAWTFYNLARRYDELRGISDSHSIRGSLTTKLLASLRVIAPQTALMQHFGSVAEALLETQAANRRRATTLAGLRELLLPRLISGKLRLPEAEAQAEEALA